MENNKKVMMKKAYIIMIMTASLSDAKIKRIRGMNSRGMAGFVTRVNVRMWR